MASQQDLARAIMMGRRQTRAFREGLVSHQGQDRVVEAAALGDAQTLRHIRVGLGLTLLYETARVFSASWISPTPATFYPVILSDIAITSIAFALTSTPWCRRRWRELVFVECFAIVISSVIISALTAQPIQCFIAAVLLQVGVAALVPWGPRWQAALMTLCLSAIVVDSLLVPSAGASTVYLWMELLAAAGLAQFVAALTEGYRREIEGGIRELRENEAKLLLALSRSARSPAGPRPPRVPQSGFQPR